MKPRLLSVRRAEFIPAPFFGKNESGCEPIGDRVLIKPDIAASTSGGIQIPDEVIDRAQLSSSSGVIVALGEGAFEWNSDRTRPFTGERPKTGDRVHFDKFAGKLILGDDGVEYRLLDDNSIGGVRR